MKIIKLEGRIIYRAAKGKKVEFVNTESKYSEIGISKDDERKVVEVDD